MDSAHIIIKADAGINKYPAKSHVRRVAQATGVSAGLIALEGEKSAYYSNSDQKRHWRQDRYFYYLTGCNEPDCHVTYDIGKDVLTLWLPRIDYSRVFYDGRTVTVEEALERYDIDEARYRSREASGKTLSLEESIRDEFCGIARIKGEVLKHALDVCRAVKDADEIALIRKANDVSSQAHRAILTRLGELTSEQEVAGLFLNTCISAGAHEQAYDPIAGSGPRAGILHYMANEHKFGDSQVLLVDASCEWDLYASDITRTIPLNRERPGHWPSRETEAIYKAVEKIQEECIARIKPGKNFVDLHWHASHMAIDALLALRILEGDHMDIFHAGTVKAFAPHGLGHHIGLEVHDLSPPPSKEMLQFVPSLTEAYALFSWSAARYHAQPSFTEPQHLHLRLASLEGVANLAAPPLEQGNVVTIEPGLYFNQFILETFFLNDPVHRKFINWEVLKRYMAVGGVRIEDCILVTETGYENLTKAVKGEDMLRVIRGE